MAAASCPRPAAAGALPMRPKRRSMLTSLLLKLTYLGAEWILWLLLALSIVSIAVIVERWLYFRRTRVDGDELAAQLQEHCGPATCPAPGNS